MRGRAPALIFGLVLAPIVLQWRGIFLGRVLFFEDIAAYFEPLWTAVARKMRSGHLPSWAPEAFSGQPLLGDPQIGIFYPPHWIWLALSPVRTYALSIVAHDLWVAAGTYGLCRALGRSRAASAGAAIAISLSAYFVLEARHEMFLVSAAWLPWLLWAIARWAETRSLRSLAAIAISFAMALLGGGWSMLLFAAPIVLVFAIARTRRRPAVGVGLVGVGLGLALGLALAAVQVLPALAHARLSPRSLALSEAFAGSYSWPSLRYAWTLLFPTWYGDDALGTYRGAPDQWELSGYGVGFVATLCMLLALRGRARRGETIAYFALIAVAMLAALGPHGPLWSIARALPLVGRLRCPARALFLFTTVAPLLCAAGIDRLRASLPRRARALVWAIPPMIALELLITFRAENPTVPAEEARVSAAVTEQLQRAPSAGPAGWRSIIDVHLGQTFHNGGLRWGVEVAGGYSSLPLWRYLHFLWIANHRRTFPGWPHPALDRDLTAQGLWTFGSPLVDLLGVRWALLPHDRAPDGGGWRREVVGVDGVDLWQNADALWRARLVHRVRTVADEGAAAEAIASVRFDPANEAIAETPLELEEGEASNVPMERNDGEQLRFSLVAATRGLVAIAIPFEPSWSATLDDHEVPLLRVDYALLGVVVGPGAHRLVIARHDRALRAGVICTGLAFAIWLALLLVRKRPKAAR